MSKDQAVISPRQELYLGRLSEAKERLKAVIHGLAPNVLCEEEVLAGWTVKDLLGHIVSWNEEFRANIEDILAGRHPGYDHQISGEANFSASNQVWVEGKRSLPLQKILDDLERDYDEAARLIKSLKPQQMRLRGVTPWKTATLSKPTEPGKQDTDSVATLITFHWRHMNEHCQQIEQWRKGWEADRVAY